LLVHVAQVLGVPLRVVLEHMWRSKSRDATVVERCTVVGR
jgi:hypothetical protein